MLWEQKEIMNIIKIVNKKLMYRITTALIIGFIILFFGTKTTKAKTFELNLYFDKETKQISFDRDSVDKIEVSPDLLTMKDIRENEPKSEYYFKMLSFDAKELAKANFVPSEGRLKLSLPYYNTIYKIELYNNSSLLLSADTAFFATCNLNNLCESSKGENVQNCIADCFSQEVAKIKNKSYNNTGTGNGQNLEPSDPLTGAKKDEAASQNTTETKTPFFGLIVGSFMILGGIGYGVYRLIKSRRNEE